jgi:hypothetical protein
MNSKYAAEWEDCMMICRMGRIAHSITVDVFVLLHDYFCKTKSYLGLRFKSTRSVPLLISGLRHTARRTMKAKQKKQKAYGLIFYMRRKEGTERVISNM